MDPPSKKIVECNEEEDNYKDDPSYKYEEEPYDSYEDEEINEDEYDQEWDDIPVEVSPQKPNKIVDDHHQLQNYPTYSHPSFFDQFYHAYPLCHTDKPYLEYGNKIIMPPSALGRLSNMPDVDYPMLFQIQNPNNESSGHVSHCGVSEFSAEEGFVFIPAWMMKNLQVKERQLVNLKNVSLWKGEYMKIQPHTTDFVMKISDPKSVLEKALRDFACLTTGDTIVINHMEEEFYVDIVETKPFGAISMTDTDCEVDFAPPLDYKEPVKEHKSLDETKQEESLSESHDQPFVGVSRRLDGKAPAAEVGSSSVVQPMKKLDLDSKTPKKPEEKSSSKRHENIEEKKFEAFTGKGRTLMF